MSADLAVANLQSSPAALAAAIVLAVTLVVCARVVWGRRRSVALRRTDYWPARWVGKTGRHVAGAR